MISLKGVQKTSESSTRIGVALTGGLVHQLGFGG